MKLISSCIADNSPIPAECAFAIPDRKKHITLSQDVNPDFAWTDLPAGTKSLALVCVDPDVPSRGDDVNKEGRTVAAALPRVNFYHWVLVDLPPDSPAISKGEFSSKVIPKGKGGPLGPRETRQGLNDYTGLFASDHDMGGEYFGYDGPCPPWNDEIPHRYVFTLYALDIPKVPVKGSFDGPGVLKAIEGHVLAKASLMGRYTLNPAVKL
jgi:Raf kinase inhibitor-like YbhB/YbcL family protein